MARVDTLPEGAKEVLQTGAVIGREFSHELIGRITGLPEKELISCISAAKDAELLYERGVFPRSTYVLKHALTQEVIYDSILTNRRKQLHERIGQVYEVLYGDSLEEHYGVLAEHFIESENYEKGAWYAKQAGKKAQKKASYIEAIRHGQRRIYCLERLPKTEDNQKKVIDGRVVLAGYYMALNLHVEAKEAVDPVLDLAVSLDYRRRLPGIYTAIGIHKLWVEENFTEAFRYLNEVLDISEDVGDYFSLWFASYFLACHLSWNCEFEKGYAYFNKSLEMSRAANNLLGISSTKSAMSSHNRIFCGDIDLAYHLSKEAVHDAEESGDIYAKGQAYTSCGISCYCKGMIHEAGNYLTEGLSCCEKTAQVTWGALASFWLGFMFFETGQYEKALAYHNKSIIILTDAGLSPSWRNVHKLCLARARVLCKDKDIDLQELYGYYKRNRLKICEGWNARYIGEILLHMEEGYLSEAEGWVRRAIETDKANGMFWFLAGDYLVYAKMLRRKGDSMRAEEHIELARGIFKRCGAAAYTEQAEKGLERL
jgi:tetratricopeptide (TPR) repeat protein